MSVLGIRKKKMLCFPDPSKKVRYGDPGFEEAVRRWMKEAETDIGDYDNDTGSGFNLYMDPWDPSLPNNFES